MKTKSDLVDRQKIREEYYVFLSSPDLIGFRHSLFLNIVIPPSFDPNSISAKFPVKVYIHGGYDRNSRLVDFNLKTLHATVSSNSVLLMVSVLKHNTLLQLAMKSM